MFIFFGYVYIYLDYKYKFLVVNKFLKFKIIQ